MVFFPLVLPVGPLEEAVAYLIDYSWQDLE